MTTLDWGGVRAKGRKKHHGVLQGRRLKSAMSYSNTEPFWGEFSARVEVCGGAIIHDEFQPNFYVMELVTAEGGRRFRDAREIHSCDVQSELGKQNWEHELRARARLLKLMQYLASYAKEAGKFAIQLRPRRERAFWEESVELEFLDPETRCGSIIDSLRRPDLGHGERRKLILESEVRPFRGQQAAALVPLLGQFIETYRESSDHADVVAVGSAIRNYVATATIDDAFQVAVSLLKAEGRLPIPIELEIEVTKMVVRKLTANPPTERDQYTGLAQRLEEIVDAYAKPRLLARDRYGAVAMNGVLGLVLTRSGRDAEVVDRMRKLGVGWFQQLLARRATLLRADLLARDTAAKFADIARVLEQLGELNSSPIAS
jgi:hypothetical protein